VQKEFRASLIPGWKDFEVVLEAYGGDIGKVMVSVPRMWIKKLEAEK
jgi:hypothetical protein